jgi:hypothetical protein
LIDEPLTTPVQAGDLQLAQRSENEKRKSWRYRAKRTTCPKGHDLKLHGVVTPEGGRVCRQCNRDTQGAI